MIAGRYEIQHELGRGGMGAVYLARHLKTQGMVALKLLGGLTGLTRTYTEDQTRRFLREPRAIARIKHENVVQIHDCGDAEDGTLFLVMEHLHGQDLSHLLCSGEPLGAERTRDLMVQICRGVGAAHHHGVVHRDLKPGNVFLVPRAGGGDLVKVLDFGLAKILDPESGEQSLTREGSLMGTPAYMAPEQVRGDLVDERTDVYALGCVLYEMLTGRPPFRGPLQSVLARKMIEDVPPPSSLTSVPADLEAVCLRALRRDPSLRFPSMEAMEEALLGTAAVLALQQGHGQGGAEADTVVLPGMTRPRRWQLWAAAGAMALLALCSTVLVSQKWRGSASRAQVNPASISPVEAHPAPAQPAPQAEIPAPPRYDAGVATGAAAAPAPTHALSAAPTAPGPGPTGVNPHPKVKQKASPPREPAEPLIRKGRVVTLPPLSGSQ